MCVKREEIHWKRSRFYYFNIGPNTNIYKLNHTQKKKKNL